VLAHLNARTGRSGASAFRGASALATIAARLAEFTETELRAVVDHRVALWASDEKMAPYLRPSTLFARAKLADYVALAARQRPADPPARSDCFVCGRPTVPGTARCQEDTHD
jgi:uncharacterized phage protein (TIGR02220 family)